MERARQAETDRQKHVPILELKGGVKRAKRAERQTARQTDRNMFRY